jgi:hypothetical protein
MSWSQNLFCRKERVAKQARGKDCCILPAFSPTLMTQRILIFKTCLEKAPDHWQNSDSLLMAVCLFLLHKHFLSMAASCLTPKPASSRKQAQFHCFDHHLSVNGWSASLQVVHIFLLMPCGQLCLKPHSPQTPHVWH